MSNRPNRTFVYLALVMVFVLVIGLVVVGMLVSGNRPLAGDHFTASAIIASNNTIESALSETQTGTHLISSFTPIPYDASISPTALPNFSPVPTLTPTLTFTPLAYSACSWQWARQPLPEVGMAALEAFVEAEMTFISVRAEAYGENCVDGTTNTVNYFATMTTDFYVDAQINDLSNDSEIAEIVMGIYHVLTDLPPDILPARLGYLEITFIPFEQPTKRLRASFDQITAALLAEASDSQLIEVLGGLS